MLIGQKGKEIGTLACLRTLRAKKKGFTLVELLVTGFIFAVVMAALFLSLTTGEFSNSVSSAKADLQAKVRFIMEMIVRDVRQTNLNEINLNGPSADHIKFRQVTGIDSGGTSEYSLSANYIEYTYDINTRQLTRSIVNGAGAILRSQVFADITNTHFYSNVGQDLAANTIIDPNNGGKLIITVAAQSQANRLTLNWTLTEEVKIRNE